MRQLPWHRGERFEDIDGLQKDRAEGKFGAFPRNSGARTRTRPGGSLGLPHRGARERVEGRVIGQMCVVDGDSQRQVPGPSPQRPARRTGDRRTARRPRDGSLASSSGRQERCWPHARRPAPRLKCLSPLGTRARSRREVSLAYARPRIGTPCSEPRYRPPYLQWLSRLAAVKMRHARCSWQREVAQRSRPVSA